MACFHHIKPIQKNASQGSKGNSDRPNSVPERHLHYQAMRYFLSFSYNRCTFLGQMYVLGDERFWDFEKQYFIWDDNQLLNLNLEWLTKTLFKSINTFTLPEGTLPLHISNMITSMLVTDVGDEVSW